MSNDPHALTHLWQYSPGEWSAVDAARAARLKAAGEYVIPKSWPRSQSIIPFSPNDPFSSMRTPDGRINRDLLDRPARTGYPATEPSS